jgi:hypothetical protein
MQYPSDPEYGHGFAPAPTPIQPMYYPGMPMQQTFPPQYAPQYAPQSPMVIAANSDSSRITQPVSITVEIHLFADANFLVVSHASTFHVVLRNASNYGIQVRHNTGSLALAPNESSNEFIFRNPVVGRHWMETFELAQVLGVNGEIIPLYNLKKVIPSYKVKYSFCFAPLCTCPQHASI